MKILMINSVCGIGSTGRICTDLATELEKQGHEVKIAYGRGGVPKQFSKYAIRVGNNLDVMLHGIKARVYDASGFGSKRVTMRFIDWIESYNPDIIHLHNLHGYYINIDILFKYLKKSNKKIIWTLHDCWSFTGHTVYCDMVNCEKWKYGCDKCPLLKEYPTTFLDNSRRNWNRKKELFTGISNMMIITPSLWLSNLVKKSFLQEYVVEVINNGINTTEFHSVRSNFRKEYGLEDKFILLGVATAWDDNKGLSDFLKLQKYLDNDYKIVLVGLTKKQIRKLPKNILGIERTANIRQLAEIYTASNIFLNLSYCENYPTVNLESMACGTSIIAYGVGGNIEIVDKCGGHIVSKGDIQAVVRSIKQIQKEKVKINFKPEENDCVYAINKYLKYY